MSKSMDEATDFVRKVTELGFRVERERTSGVVTVSTTFSPGDTQAYIMADSDAHALISDVPVVTYGSTWGTTSDGVGGHAGMMGGYVRLSKSGVSKRFVTALVKVLDKR